MRTRLPAWNFRRADATRLGDGQEGVQKLSPVYGPSVPTENLYATERRKLGRDALPILSTTASVTSPSVAGHRQDAANEIAS